MIKVLIVDDQELFRESLKVVLSVSENIRVTDAVSGVSQALRSAEQERPDVVLMDIRMPGMDGVEGTRLLKKRWPDVKIIVLTTFDDDEYIFGALKNGASGYLLKGSSIAKLSESIRIAYEDGAIITPTVATKVIHQFSHMAQGSSRLQVDKEAVKDISRSEWQIIQTVGAGCPTRRLLRSFPYPRGPFATPSATSCSSWVCGTAHSWQSGPYKPGR